MGKRDYRHRETKKPRKDARKLSVTTTSVPPPAPVEVIRKGKKEPEERED